MEDKVSESASGTVRRMEKASHEFVVDYSLHKGIGVNQPIESDQFVVGGHPWTIYFYPDGKEDGAYDVGYASLYICLNSEGIEGIEPVEFVSELYILDQTGKGRHWGVSSFEGRNTYRLVQSLRPGFMSGNLRAISRALLESPVYGYVKDDCLKIRATIGVFTYHMQSQPLIKVPKSNMGQLGDEHVFFKVAHQRFWAHKLILAARCPALLARLSDVHQLQDIVIPDMEPKIFKAVLWFIYKGTLQKEDQEAVCDSGPFVLKSFLAKMLAAADQFELKRLKEICESRILEKVSGESVGYLLHLADLYHATKLKGACLRFAAENQAAIMESEGYEYLKETCPLLFLELAGFRDNPSTEDNSSTSIEWVLNVCNKVLSTYKESLVGRRWPWGATYKKQKKEV